MAVQRLREAAEKAKIELSNTVETEINLPFITADASGPKHLVLKITRSKFEQLVEDLVKGTLKPCEQALRDAGLRPGEIAEIYSEFKKDSGIDLGNDKMAVQRLREAAEKAKIELSNTVGQSCRGRFVYYALYVKTGYLPGVFRCLALTVVKIRGNGNNGFLDF